MAVFVFPSRAATLIIWQIKAAKCCYGYELRVHVSFHMRLEPVTSGSNAREIRGDWWKCHQKNET